ncbi:hypothetical protein ACFQ2B_19305 [Streptomyces stramineus]
MRPLIESVVNNTHIRALAESTLADIGDVEAAVHALNSLVRQAKRSVAVLLPTTRGGLRAVDSALRQLAGRWPQDGRIRILSTPEMAAGCGLNGLATLAPGVEVRLAAGSGTGPSSWTSRSRSCARARRPPESRRPSSARPPSSRRCTT